MDIFSHMPKIQQRIYKRALKLVEDEYEVYSPREIDPATRRCRVLKTGTQLECRQFWQLHEKRNSLRIRATGEEL
jgi:hypothetical protein